MARIAIYIARHLCTAPRPQKEAEALAAAGHDVIVRGLWFDAESAARDTALVAGRRWRFVHYANCLPGTRRQRARWWRLRLQHRFARDLYRRTGWITPDLFGYGTAIMARTAARTPADLSIFHSEGGLWAGTKLLARGRRAGFDFEDWFSRDLTPAQQVGRPINKLAELERVALCRSHYVLTTSRAMAQALAGAYEAPVPAVIYNAFPQASPSPGLVAGTRDRSETGRISLHWFSLVIGPDRGLETLFAALPALPPGWELFLRGEVPASYRTQLLASIPGDLRALVHFLPTVPNAELPQRIAEHDIGLALDLPTIPSRNLTITNKVFQYLQGGLALVASDTAGNREVVEKAPGIGVIFPAENVAALAAAVGRFCRDPAALARAKTTARAAAENVFAHEKQCPHYAELVELALSAS